MKRLPINNKGQTNVLILARKETSLKEEDFVIKSMSRYERPLNVTILSDPEKILEYNRKNKAQFYVIDPYFSNYTKLFEEGLKLFTSNRHKIFFLDRKNTPQFIENFPNIKSNVDSILNAIEKINKIKHENLKVTIEGSNYLQYRMTGAIHVAGGFAEKYVEKIKQKKMSGARLDIDEIYLTELYTSKINFEKIIKKARTSGNYDKKLLNNVMDHYKDVLEKIKILNKPINNPERRELIAKYHSKLVKQKEIKNELARKEALRKQMNQIEKEKKKLRFLNFKFRHRK